MMNQINQKIVLLLIILIISACSRAKDLPAVATTANSAATNAVSKLTLQSHHPTATPTSTPVPYNPAIQACVSPDEDQKKLKASGVLILETFLMPERM